MRMVFFPSSLVYAHILLFSTYIVYQQSLKSTNIRKIARITNGPLAKPNIVSPTGMIFSSHRVNSSRVAQGIHCRKRVRNNSMTTRQRSSMWRNTSSTTNR